MIARPFRILQGDALATLRTLPDRSVHCCVTSPPYWGLRDYGVDGQIGLERTPEEYLTRLVEVFREVRRVLRDDGTLWLNLGDCYATGAGKVGDHPGGGEQGARWKGDVHGGHRGSRGGSPKQPHTGANVGPMTQPNRLPLPGLKPKDLVGIPWMVSFALRADGWYLRSDIIWHKPNPMPESVTDRPTKAHEYLFLLSKSERYFYDHEAVKEPATDTGRVNGRNGRDEEASARPPGSSPRTLARIDYTTSGRNKRSVWTVATHPYAEAHFATFPPALVEPCIKAGTSERGVCPGCGAPWERVAGEKIPVDGPRAGNKQRSIADGTDGDRPADHLGRGVPWVPSVTPTVGWRPSCKCPNGGGNPVAATVLDPFSGAGTVALVATRLQRQAIGIELSAEYVAMSERRIENDAPLFNAAR